MEIIYVGVVFLVIIIALGLKRPLYQAVLAGIVMMMFFFRISLKDSFNQFLNVLTNWSSLQILISIYLITFLQRMLEKRNQIKLAQIDLENIFHSTRITCAGRVCLLVYCHLQLLWCYVAKW